MINPNENENHGKTTVVHMLPEGKMTGTQMVMVRNALKTNHPTARLKNTETTKTPDKESSPKLFGPEA